MIPRLLSQELHKLLFEYPVVTVIGPRQAGKTTLVRSQLPDHQYCNLESPENRQFAEADPVGFLKQFSGPCILDEIQRVPKLLSYIQTMVDQDASSKNSNGRYILTGSHQLLLQEAITQSLAGRTAILKLLPFSMEELDQAGIGFDRFEDYVHHGFLPRIYDQKQRPYQAYGNYYLAFDS